MSQRRSGIMSTWFHEERAKHDRELGAPQPFPLAGDGEHLASAIGGKWDGGKLADARYRDWLAQRERQR
jgi:hypothetical protein